MPRVIITAVPLMGLERCRHFRGQSDGSLASRRAAPTIEQQFLLLESTPGVGRPLPDLPKLRELVIVFGDSGYVALFG